MKILIISDLHNEFNQYKPINVDCDMVVLAGDVALGMNGLKWIKTVYPNKDVVYVAGNHEYYGHAIPKLTNKLRLESKNTSIRFLECESALINGIRFLGCTLWSDQNIINDHYASIEAAQNLMTDYKRIRVSPQYRKLRPLDTQNINSYSIKWLNECVREFTEPLVVVTHHAPSARSLKPGTEIEPLSGSYASHLDDFIVNSGIKLWIHGHTHYSVDYSIGKTRILSNQRGYPEQSTGFHENLVIEL